MLWLRKRVTLNEAPYLIQDKIGGGYDDALSLLIEAVKDGDLPAEVSPDIDPWSEVKIALVDPSKSTVATADVAAWLPSLRRNDMPQGQPTAPVKSGAPVGEAAIATSHVLGDEPSKGNPANRFVEQVADEIEDGGKVPTLSAVWKELFNRIGKSVIVDSKDGALMCDNGGNTCIS